MSGFPATSNALRYLALADLGRNTWWRYLLGIAVIAASWLIGGAYAYGLMLRAPLGAIIRKGGMGLPVVAAIIFFLIFHIISFSTEKLVIAGELPAWPGMWISTLALAPFGIVLTWKATADSPLFDRDAYYRGWERFRSLFRRSHADPTVVQ